MMGDLLTAALMPDLAEVASAVSTTPATSPIMRMPTGRAIPNFRITRASSSNPILTTDRTRKASSKSLDRGKPAATEPFQRSQYSAAKPLQRSAQPADQPHQHLE